MRNIKKQLSVCTKWLSSLDVIYPEIIVSPLHTSLPFVKCPDANPEGHSDRTTQHLEYSRRVQTKNKKWGNPPCHRYSPRPQLLKGGGCTFRSPSTSTRKRKGVQSLQDYFGVIPSETIWSKTTPLRKNSSCLTKLDKVLPRKRRDGRHLGPSKKRREVTLLDHLKDLHFECFRL